MSSSLREHDDTTEVTSTVADRQLLEKLFGDLYENRIIYHERITVLAKVERVEVGDRVFDLWFRPIKLLYKPDIYWVEGMYERWVSSSPIQIGANFDIPDIPYHYDSNGRLSMAYSSHLIWPHKEVVKEISLMTDEELKTDLRRALRETRT